MCLCIIRKRSDITMNYTSGEYCDILLILGQCNNQAGAAARRYVEYYPHRRHPNANVIRRAEIRLRETGTIIHRQDARRGRNVRTIVVEEEISEMIEEEPGISIRAISRQINVSRSTVHRVLQDERPNDKIRYDVLLLLPLVVVPLRNGMHPYHFSMTQQLKEEDAEHRIEFCRWLLCQHMK